ncbi:MAG: hypothetical protein EZS28_005356 [Streblomastix strix]|uniref:Uncharacterized protein n=1 Tax=Streblomastix strix TaxID=222440 RepID=A0A5J4WW00_9EUKA|nr:MAG: hypothetical protein EZS28_005356 [Streblomastix strix]
MTGSELVYAIYLIQKLVESEIQDLDQDKQSAMITESNIGTVLICAVILAMKVLRDVIEKNNSWWAKAFEMINITKSFLDLMIDSNSVALINVTLMTSSD